ncbi:hypothetical protein I2I11_04135 [Pontibacter sp. 172403-2]|uniref:hypothetical protein n=1 Tax=Pontibacter rufus TaxID=2791028 RepID=UPI0018AF7EFD|nr:hypothetical protein [Pontibacter sp. 172403-2]MBF9252473.1 hypothetical protein [Pontibacter sp. 172403-2]
MAKKQTRLLLKEIPILPSMFKLDIVVCTSLETVAAFCHKRYGETERWYMENFHLDSCCTLDTTVASELKGALRTVVVLKQKKVHIVAHELIHALLALSG